MGLKVGEPVGLGIGFWLKIGGILNGPEVVEADKGGHSGT